MRRGAPRDDLSFRLHESLVPYWREFAEGALLTLQMSAISTVIGCILGSLFAIGRARGPRWMQIVLAAYVELMRNTPLLVQVFIVYFGIATVGIRVGGFDCRHPGAGDQRVGLHLRDRPGRARSRSIPRNSRRPNVWGCRAFRSTATSS